MNNHPNHAPGPLRRWAPWALAALLITGLMVWAFQPRAMTVELGSVTLGRFEQVLEEDGQLRLKQRYLVTAPIPADMARPTWKVGDEVRQGDVVATLSPLAPQMIDARTREVLQQRVGSADAARLAAAARLQRLETALAQAGLEAERADQLARDNFIAASARDQTALALRSARQALAAGRAELSAAAFALAESRAALAQAQPTAGARAGGTWQLKSPVNGRVIKLHLDSAATVQAGQALLEIGDTTALEAFIDVLSTDVPRIPPHAPAALMPGAGLLVLQGRVSRVEPVAFTKVSALGIEEQRVNVVVETIADTGTQGALGDGYRVEARITLSVHDNALQVPTAALMRSADQWQVLVVENGRTHARPVNVLERHADMARVETAATGSVKAGDRVVLYPGSTVQAGQKVKTGD
jgi:HlyD family secretion protein